MRQTNYAVKNTKDVNTSIVLLADIHGFPMGKDVLELIRKDKPSAIMITGDLVDEVRPFTDATRGLLKWCAETAPTFFSFGNNDEVLTDENIREMKSMGVHVLDNEWTEFQPGVFVGGLTSAMVLRCRQFGPHAKEKVTTDIDWLEGFSRLDGYKILLDHHPENYRLYTREKNIDIILSGHTHGGQISIFGYGLLVPGQKLWPRYSGGYYENKIIVSRGMSNSLPIPRIWNPPEVVYIAINGKKEK